MTPREHSTHPVAMERIRLFKDAAHRLVDLASGLHQPRSGWRRSYRDGLNRIGREWRGRLPTCVCERNNHGVDTGEPVQAIGRRLQISVFEAPRNVVGEPGADVKSK